MSDPQLASGAWRALRHGVRVLVLLAAAALPWPIGSAAQGDAPTPAAKTPITRADQLPRRTYTLPRLPSELLESPLGDLSPLADALERDLLSDLTRFDIQDQATMRGFVSTRMNIAALRGDWAAIGPLAAQLRTLQDKPATKLTSGLLFELLAQVKREGKGADAMQALVVRRFGALPWADVQDALKAMKAQLEVANPALVIGTVRSQADEAARNANRVVDASMVSALLGARVQLDHVLPLRSAIAGGLTQVVERQAAGAPPKPDRWSERLVNLPATGPGRPIVVGIWDSGVDMALFRPAEQRGLAFDEEGQTTPDILRPLGDAQSRWPQLKRLVKGSLDLRAALDTEEARQLKQTMSQLKPEQVRAFQEDLALASLYTHGTHVAGIAVAGNPFALVYPVAIHWSHSSIPRKPTEAIARARAANYQHIVDSFKAAQVRVVNMSWRYGPGFFESALAFHGVGKDGEERKKLAQALFNIERDALKAAFQSAPDILFVAGAGNEDNSADFVEYIPAGFELPNLITAGAVDRAGEETGFSSFGKTVVVHANGFEVDSVIPGGEHLKLSGTSMAAPQVTNLAAKLFALDPKLSAAQAKALILAGAERRGRVNLINPKATIARLGVNQSAQRAGGG
ncbi:MAG TPA: S8 family serine peptidase [Burkholderiaceae bacterium]|nr:S8 family serine peptidase [Burkholderiaceae bacterium]